jgi:hypothetical protein
LPPEVELSHHDEPHVSWLTTAETAALISERLSPHTVSDEWVRNQTRAGRLRCLRVSPKKILYRRDEVEAFLERVERESEAVA